MTVATLPVSNLPHALSRLSPSSNPRPSSSPAMIPVFPPSGRSGTMSNLSYDKAVPIHHITYTGGVGQRIPLDIPLDAGSDRDSAFIASHSRVLKLYNLPPLPSVFLRDLFVNSSQVTKTAVPIPKSLWTRRTEHGGGVPGDGVWAVFATHEEARFALALFGARVSVSPALESDLEPLHSLQKVQLRPVTDPAMSIESPIPTNSLSSCDLISRRMESLWLSCSLSRHSPDSGVQNNSPAPSFTLSSNPPNPRNVFRMGDWMCPSTNCAAHNFGRNFTCIGCGYPRPSTSHVPLVRRTSLSAISPAQVPSPRFAGTFETPMPASLSHRVPHILTPSGRAFSIGGRVQDVSSDPLSSCFLFWPDNEPLPEQGQLRPSILIGIPHPPILNTGNKGPIEHQPGDWICKKCNYLNWRRRKVCQTCYPYAEGNGDSIPAAVQADRIRRLREALTATVPPSPSPLQTASMDLPQSPHVHIQRPHDCHPSSCGYPTGCSSAFPTRHRTQSNLELGSQYKDTIYQTSTHPISSLYRDAAPLPMDNASGRFLPSCLQDIVQSPSLSPTSTASADLSVDEYVSSPVSVYSTGSAKLYPNGDRPLRVHRTPSSVSLGLGNIWQLDGEESKALSSSLSPQNEISRG